MEKPLETVGWTHSLGGAGPQGITGVWRTVKARLMDSQIPHPAAGNVAGASKRNNGISTIFLVENCSLSSHPNALKFSSSLYVPRSFQAVASALELRGSEF